jgi:hypothetical protein
MSIVIPFRASKQRAPNGDVNGDAPQFVAITLAKVELVCWRIMAAELRKLEGRARKCKDALELLPNSPDKSSAVNGLAVALERIRAELAVCFSAANQLEGRLGQDAPT